MAVVSRIVTRLKNWLVVAPEFSHSGLIGRIANTRFVRSFSRTVRLGSVWQISLIDAQDDKRISVVKWPTPHSVPDCLRPTSLLTDDLKGNAAFRTRAKLGERQADGLILVALRPKGFEVNQAWIDSHWSKRSYRWRCRLWFLWREYLREPWDFIKKPLILAAIAVYPLIQVLETLGVIGGCACPPPGP